MDKSARYLYKIIRKREDMIEEWIQKEHLENKEALKATFQKAIPFPHLSIEEFFIQEKVEDIFEALLEEEFISKRSDLFKFKQTNDLISTSNQTLANFYTFLSSNEFRNFMQDITGLSLKEGANNVAGTLYEDTDYLLIHDDQLDARKIAYLLYLTDLDEETGGGLELYSNDQGTPKEVVKKLYPKTNSFTFFEVSNISYHAVEEVIDAQRLAIGGWLHGA